MIVLHPENHGPKVKGFEDGLRERIVGQDEVISELVSVYQTVLAGLNMPGRPVINMLFLGPTGVGKTRTVEAVAEILFGNGASLLKINCAEFQHSHEISKLIGSPPGYLGHRETRAVLNQEMIDSLHHDTINLGLVLFDEIEKASNALWALMLGILDKAALTLGDNSKTDFSKTAIVMTSNLGAREMGRLLSEPIGFAPARKDVRRGNVHGEIQKVAVEAAKRQFSPEFMNRIDRVLVFKPLVEKHLRKILDIELKMVQRQIQTPQNEKMFDIKYTEEAKDFLLKSGTDIQYGARHLKRAILHHLIQPLAGLLASGQILYGEVVLVDCPSTAQTLIFSKEEPKENVAVFSAKNK